MTDETYIKMVLALPPEFFKDLNVENGDQVFLMKDVPATDYPSSYGHGLYTVFENSLAFEGHICTEHWMGVYCLLKEGSARIIPSTEQLLKIGDCDGDTYFESLAILHFAYWLEDKVTARHDFCLKHRSAKEMMLLWVMETRFNQKWNGEAWV